MKTDYRKLDQRAQEKIRTQAVKLLKKRTQKEVSDFLGIKQQVLSKWWCIYKKQGVSGLKMKSRKPKSDNSKVSEAQARAVRKIILEKTPDQLQFGFMLWTREAVRMTLKELYDIRLGLVKMGISKNSDFSKKSTRRNPLG